MIYSHDRILYSNGNKQTVSRYNNIEKSHKHVEQDKPDAESSLYDSIWIVHNQTELICDVRSQGTNFPWWEKQGRKGLSRVLVVFYFLIWMIVTD